MKSCGGGGGWREENRYSFRAEGKKAEVDQAWGAKTRGGEGFFQGSGMDPGIGEWRKRGNPLEEKRKNCAKGESNAFAGVTKSAG